MAWPQANGVAPGGNPPTEFSEEKNIQWKIKVPGSGSSTPGGFGREVQVFILTAVATGKNLAAPEGWLVRRSGGRGTQRDPRPRGHVAADAPGRSDRSERSERGDRGRGGFGGGGFNREEMIKRFDKGGDGELNEAERGDALRDSFDGNLAGIAVANAVDAVGAPAWWWWIGSSRKPTEEFQFLLISYDRNSGKEKWRSVATAAVPHGHHRDHGYASASPVTDGENIIVSFGSRGLYFITT